MKEEMKKRIEKAVEVASSLQAIEKDDEIVEVLHEILVRLMLAGFSFGFTRYPNGRIASHFEKDGKIFSMLGNDSVTALLGSAEKALGLVKEPPKITLQNVMPRPEAEKRPSAKVEKTPAGKTPAVKKAKKS